MRGYSYSVCTELGKPLGRFHYLEDAVRFARIRPELRVIIRHRGKIAIAVYGQTTESFFLRLGAYGKWYSEGGLVDRKREADSLTLIKAAVIMDSAPKNDWRIYRDE